MQTEWWAVMRAVPWDKVTIQGNKLTPPIEGPCRFIPLFDTREQAITFENGSSENVFKVTTTGAF